MSAAVLWAVPGLPACVGVLLAVIQPRSRRLAVTATVGAATVTVGLSLWAALSAPSVSAPFVLGTGFDLAVDPLAGPVLITVAVVTWVVLIFAAADTDRDAARFGGLMLLFLAAVVVTVTATTVPALLLAWEVMGATSYALIGFAWDRPGKLQAGAVAFITTRSADLGLYLAAGAALAGGAGLGLADLAQAPGGWRTAIAVGIAVAALGKAAQLPFAFWLSRAMEGPSPVSALLHSAAMVAMGGYLLLRVPGLLAAVPAVATAVAWVGALTAVALGLVALAQRDLKQLLAASTAAQLGYVVLAAGVGGVTAGATHLIAHAATKALLFLTAGAWLSALGTKQLDALSGVARRWRSVGVLATIGLLSLAGAAPLSLWASKEAVLASVLSASPWLYGVGLAGAVLSAAYAGRALAVIWQKAPPGVEAGFDTEQPGTRRVAPGMVLPLALLAGGAATLGVLVLPPVSVAWRAAVGDDRSVDPGALGLAVAAALAIAVLAAVWRWPVPTPDWAHDWLRLETAAGRLVVVPTIRTAALLARFDDRVVDRGVVGLARGGFGLATRLARFDDRGLDVAVTGLARRTFDLAGRSARIDDGVVDAAVVGFARSLRRAGRAAQRPQTGQLHEYYLQSVAVLAGALLLLVLIG